MRWAVLIAGALSLWTVGVPPAAAGLYNTAEPAAIPTRDFRKFQDALILLRQGALPIQLANGQEIRTPLYRRFELIATLNSRSADQLTVEQRLDLGAYLIRLQKFRQAADVLMPARRQEPDNALVLSNLATAEQLDGQVLRARDYLSAALQSWPQEWSDRNEARPKWLRQVEWRQQDYLWYREVETYQLKLLRLRSREALRPAKPLPENVDDLFAASDSPAGKLQFVGPGGKYEAGKLAADQQAKLPKKAIEIVEQLLLWMPFDARLDWLLGELYNAEGNVPAATAILKDVAAKWNPRGPNQTGFTRDVPLPVLFSDHLAVLQAQTSAEPTIADTPAMTPRPAEPVDMAQEKAAPPVDWKSLGVGFGGGIAVAFLAAWQIREMRRKRGRGSIA